MEVFVKRIVELYGRWDSYKKSENPLKLALYLTHNGEFRLVDCNQMNSHCLANKKYSQLAIKQLYILKPFDTWLITNPRCHHGHFQDLTKYDFYDGWEDNVVIESAPRVFYLKRA